MFTHSRWTLAAVLFAALSWAGPAKKPDAANRREALRESTADEPRVLWREPADIAVRNLYYGSGGKDNAPHGVFTFREEDPHGTNPKFDVEDENGVKWRVKLGAEVRPETVASRLVWAAGYFTNDDYFVPELRVAGMPPRLHRGQKLILPGGLMHNARLKRFPPEEKKVDQWAWSDNPFSGTRELNGLRVLMALINNWDLKDVNNSIYAEKKGRTGNGPELIYAVSDLGASFGTGRIVWAGEKNLKGNLDRYARSRFVVAGNDEVVDFATPGKPTFLLFFVEPKQYSYRRRLRWIGDDIPRDDARWMGRLLARLSVGQISDAFRAAGYAEADIEGFTRVVHERVQELCNL